MYVVYLAGWSRFLPSSPGRPFHRQHRTPRLLRRHIQSCFSSTPLLQVQSSRTSRCIDTHMAGQPSLNEQQTWLRPGTSVQLLDSALPSDEATERTPLSRDISPAPRVETSGTNDRQSSTSSSRPSSPTSSRTQSTLTGEILSHHEISEGITRKLYVSHFLSTWNFRGFEFGAVLFLATIFPGTLLPMSSYALIRAASAIILAPASGRYIDNGERLRVIRSSIVWQRGAVVLSCALFWLMLKRKGSLPTWGIIILLGVNIFLACIEKLCSIMNTVSVERDWVIVIADGNESALREMNSQMRRIDLFCKLMSPLVIALFDGFSTEVAILVTFGINSVSMVVEYALFARVYKVVPSLAHRRTAPIAEHDEAGSTQRTRSPTRSVAQQTISLVENLQIYTSQDAFLPSLSLSILYLTVLSFAGQMVTYLLAVGYTSTIVGLIRMVSTACEMSATWLAPWAMSQLGPVRTGIWFLSFQMACLGIAVLVFWAAKAPIWAASGLVGGTALSRIGLWGFDLSAQIIIQEEVEPQHRGSFSTTEAALQNFFELCAYASTIVFFRPSDFKYPAMMSIVAVYVAGALYAKFIRDRRGHLFHSSKCMKPRDGSQPLYRQIYGDIGETLR
jgi:solute carrier family 40 (iron-regulated transporter), member 1